jgi:hypothetical protein
VKELRLSALRIPPICPPFVAAARPPSAVVGPGLAAPSSSIISPTSDSPAKWWATPAPHHGATGLHFLIVDDGESCC